MNTPINSNQKFFNDAYLGLKSQGFQQSMDEDIGYAYRGAEGFKCAVGHCIPDDRYDPSFDQRDNTSFAYRTDIQNLISELYPEVDFFLIELIQDAHDNSDVENMQDRLNNLAEAYGLEIPS